MLAFTLRKPAWSKIILEKFTIRSGPVTEGLRPSPLCAWAQWLSLGSLVDRALGDELHEACVAMALKLGGWDNAADSHTQSFGRRREKARLGSGLHGQTWFFVNPVSLHHIAFITANG
jgi:hypothetical protein